MGINDRESKNRSQGREGESGVFDSWARRDQKIVLPGRDEGYSRVLLVGATGAGKTTLLRQLIGTDPRRDRFPSTSTAKTTIFDTEIIVETRGAFRAVVSFLPHDRVRSYVEDCVAAAVSTAVSGKEDDVVLRRFLEHPEQRFRLSYLLGTLASALAPTDDSNDGLSGAALLDDGLLDDGSAAEPVVEDDEQSSHSVEVNASERQRLNLVLRGLLSGIRAVADVIAKKVAMEHKLTPRGLSPDDHDIFLEFVEDEVRLDPEARALVDDVMKEILARFDILGDGDFERDDGDWPLSWYWECSDRSLFIKALNRFSSNYAPNFGRLLAPIVQGMRVAGPFTPSWIAQTANHRFVFIDGEGLGHTPASVASLPTSITKRYDSADVILVVDNATQPMLASAQAVLRSVAASGHDGKVAIAFTHFDQVVGDNLPDVRARRLHVTASLENTLRAVEDAVGSGAGSRLRRHLLDDRILMVSNIQDAISDRNKLTLKSLGDLMDLFRRAILPVEADEATPVYDLANLVVAVERSTEQFHKHWTALLGLGSETGEHWTRIKALTRRLAYQWEDHYDTLAPVSDLVKFVTERLAAFLAKPRAWKPANCSEAAREEAVKRVSRELYARLHKLAEDRLFRDQVAGWLAAYEFRGTGSTRPRALRIVEIYEAGAPMLGKVSGTASSDLLDAFRKLFSEAAHAAAAEIVA